MNEKTNQSITVPCRETGSNNILERFRLLLIKLSLLFFSSNICVGNLNLLPCRRSKGKKNHIHGPGHLRCTSKRDQLRVIKI